MEPTQFYNPIIQAMIATANLQKQGQQQEIEKKRNEDEKKLREQALKQESDSAQRSHEMQLKAHELATKNFDLQRQKADIDAEIQHMKALSEAQQFNKGGGKAETFPWLKKILESGGQPLQQSRPELPPELNYGTEQPQTPVSAPAASPELYNAETEAANIRKLVGAQAEGVATAKEPFEIRAAQRDLADRKELEKYKATLEDADRKLDRQTQKEIAMISAAARVKDPAINPATFQSLFKLRALGQVKLNPANPTHAAVLSALEEQGANTDLSDKDVDAIKETNKLGPIFDQMETLIPQLSKGRPGAFVKGVGVKAAEAVGASSKIQNDLKILKSRAIVIGRALEGMTGRPLAIQLATDLNSLPDASITQDDARDRIKNLRDLLIGVEESLFAGMPEWQRKMVSEKYQTNPAAAKPDWLRTAPKKNAKGHTLDEATSLKHGSPVYK